MSFAYTGPGPLTERVNGYYKEFEESAVPVTPQMNPNILAIGGDLSMMVAPTDEQAIERLGKGGGFFAFGIMHYYMTGMHTPGRTGVWQRHLDEIEKDPSVVYGPDRGPIVRASRTTTPTAPTSGSLSPRFTANPRSRTRASSASSAAISSFRGRRNATRRAIARLTVRLIEMFAGEPDVA